MPIAAIARRIGISEPTTRKWANMSEAGFDELKKDDIPYLDNYREFILSILRVCPQTRETNILYRLRDEFPDFECRKTTFYKYMRKLRVQTGFIQFTGRVTSLREESPPDYEAQVDFGQYRMKDMYGKPVRVYFFCMVLAYFDNHYRNFLANNNLFLGAKLEEAYYYRVVDGCYMIFLTSEASCVGDYVMSDEQFIWLEAVLKEAAAAGGPVFVFNHHSVNYIRDEDSSKLADVLNKYDNILYIHGHIHNQLNKNSFYEWNGIKSINLPRSTEITNYPAGDGIFVEVYEDEVLVRGRNFIDGEWIVGLVFRYPISK